MQRQSPRLISFDGWLHPAGEDMLQSGPDVEVLRLARHGPAERNWPVLATAHGYQISSARDELPRAYWGHRELLARCPCLLAISSDGAGYDTVDLDACTEAGVIAVNQAGGNREAVAEHALGMMLCLAKRMPEADRALRRDRGWQRGDFMGHDLLGRTVGIIGLGHVGTRLAQLCRELFRMHVLAHDPYLTAEDFAARGATPVDLDTLLREADFVSVNCPRTQETEGMVGARAFSLMKSGAIFVTTARGGIHDEAALVLALADGRIAGAGLDVWDREPPPLDHPLLGFDNVIATPHIAGVTWESREAMSLGTAEQWLAIWRGERPPRLLNPAAWPRYRARFAELLGHMPVA